MIKNINRTSLVNIIILSLLLFSGKWLTSFIFLFGENHTLKIIEDSFQDSYMYFHYVISFSDLNFTNIYNEIYANDKFKIAPIGALIIHTIFYKFLGYYSFILLELFSIFFFILVFYLIFKEFKISNQFSLLLSILFYCLPTLIQYLTFINIIELQTFSNNFYNLRFPRPLISNLYLFLFIYILILNIKKDTFDTKYLISYSILLALSFTSFFFIFFLQLLSLIIFLLFDYKKKITKNFDIKKKEIIGSFIIFIVIVLPFVYLLKNSSPDYLERLGVINIDIYQKKEIILHYLEKLTRVKIIILYLIIYILYNFIKTKFKNNLDNIKVFLIIYFSSILSPFIFVIFSNKISFLYHFNNLVVLTSILLILMMLLAIFESYLNKIQKIKYFNQLNIIIIITLITLYNYENINTKLKNLSDNARLERNTVINLIKKNNKINLSKISLLTFDTKIMTWAIINEVPNLKILDGTYSSKNNLLTEKDLIETFKFLKLSEDDLLEFLKNKKIGYRYLNRDARKIFWQKYQANSLTTYKNSLDFDNDVLSFIDQSSPFYAHQFAIPNNEINRLISIFSSYESDVNFSPDIILIDKNKDFIKNYIIDETIYCNFYSGDYFDAFKIRNLC